jgi:hypothetical protein
LGCGGAIAKRSVGIAFGDVGMRSLLGCGGAIAKRSVGIAFGVWECDRGFGSAIAFWGSWDAIAIWGFGDAIAVLGVWGCDRF